MSYRFVPLAGASAALLVAAAGSAAAQTTPNLNANSLLQPFLGLTSQPAVLQSNLSTAVAVNNGATAAQRTQAVTDNAITSDTGAVVADGLGVRLNGAYQAAVAANNPLLAPGGNVVQAFRQANGISQADSGFNKYYFANGTTNGTTPSTLPNPNPDVYGKAYGAGNPADKFGDSRPFQAAPGIQNYAPAITSNLVNNPSFPSGHTTFGYTQSLLFAQAVPEAYQQQLTRASEYGDSRIVLGAHYPLDVAAGRIQATYDVAQLLNNNLAYLNQPISVFAVGNVTTSSNYAALFQAASADLRTMLTQGCGGTVAACAGGGGDRFSDPAQNRAAYEARLTYNLPSTGLTNLAAVVPAGSEVLLATRLPFLTAAQRRDVLASTELASGGALDNGTGWARLDLYKAASGYGAFASDVAITQDASLGGFNAASTFDNDITGSGKLTKAGTGTLALSGANSFTGGTEVDGGVLQALSTTALGTGGVALRGGTLADGAALLTLASFSADAGSTLRFDIPGAGSRRLQIGGSATLAGQLVLNFVNALLPGTSELVEIDGAAGLGGDFSAVNILGLAPGSYRKTITRTANAEFLSIQDMPEPASMALLLVSLGVVGLVRRRA